MKKNFIKMMFVLLSLFSFLSANTSSTPTPSLLTGVYRLEGTNPHSERINYRGEVEIQPYGSNYLLTWKVENSQTFTGIGILKDHILSVAYYDIFGGGGGVISFNLIKPDQLEGSWAAYGMNSQGRERLTFVSK